MLLVIAASLSLVKTFYNRIVEPSSFFSSTFCLTYLHVAYNKQKMDLLYPISKNRGEKVNIFTSKGHKKTMIIDNISFLKNILVLVIPKISYKSNFYT